MEPCGLRADSGWGLICLLAFIGSMGLVGFCAVMKAWEYGERIREMRLNRLHGRSRE